MRDGPGPAVLLGVERAFQTAFVALVSDQAVAARFEDDPEAVLASYGVSGRAAAARQGIDHTALRRYARSLVAKRWRALRETAPLSARVWPGMAAAHQGWAAFHPDPGDADPRLSPGSGEGLRALEALRAAQLADDLAPPWAPDLLAFEVFGAATRRDGRTRTFQARYRVDTLATTLRAGDLPLDPEPSPTLYRLEPGRTRWKPT